MKVGSIVECIDDSCGKASGMKLLIKGNIYEVTDIDIIGDVWVSSVHGYWWPTRFRELLPPIENIEEYIEKHTIEIEKLEPIEL